MNNTSGYSSRPSYPKAGSSHSKPPHHRQDGPSTKKVQLSVKEEEELRAAGKCFKCKEHRHMARNCSTNNSVKSSSSEKPLGLSLFSLGIDLQETERLRDAGLSECSGLSLRMVNIRGDSNSDDLEYLDPTKEGHPSGSDNAALDLFEDDSKFDDLPELMPVSDSDEEGPSYDTESDISDKQSDLSDSGLSTIDKCVEMENRASVEEDTPVPLVLTPSIQFAIYEGHIPHPSVRLPIIKMEAERHDWWALGSAAAQKLEYLLELTHPYPGDPLNVLQFRGPRFKAHQKLATEIVISDQIYDMNNTLPVDVAINQEFEVANWYARLCRERSRVTTELSPST